MPVEYWQYSFGYSAVQSIKVPSEVAREPYGLEAGDVCRNCQSWELSMRNCNVNFNCDSALRNCQLSHVPWLEDLAATSLRNPRLRRRPDSPSPPSSPWGSESAATAILSVVNTVLLRPLPSESDRLVRITEVAPPPEPGKPAAAAQHHLRRSSPSGDRERHDGGRGRDPLGSAGDGADAARHRAALGRTGHAGVVRAARHAADARPDARAR